MPDVYADIQSAGEDVQRRLADVLELRAADAQQRAMLATYIDDLDLEAGARVLEVGCGTGAVTRFLAGSASPTAASTPSCCTRCSRTCPAPSKRWPRRGEWPVLRPHRLRQPYCDGASALKRFMFSVIATSVGRRSIEEAPKKPAMPVVRSST